VRQVEAEAKASKTALEQADTELTELRMRVREGDGRHAQDATDKARLEGENLRLAEELRDARGRCVGESW
jgi:hypothetical protein